MTPEERAQRAISDSPLHEGFYVLEGNIEHQITEAVSQERERCASIAEAMGCDAVAVEIRKGE